jgi:general nucleoside transport system permease protein
MMDILAQVVNFLRLILFYMVPFVLAGQGTMIAGRTGVFNVAQEGVMLFGSAIGFLATYYTGSVLVGVLAALAGGGIFGLALAYFTTHLKMDQFVIGLALFFIGFGLHTLIPKLALGIQSTLPRIPTLTELPIPLLSQIPVLGDIFFRQNAFVYFSWLISLALWYFMYKTKYGLEMRSVGENPLAADSLGINVVFWRYSMTILGGALIGMAGAYLPMEFAGTFTPNIVAGRGWIAIALTFFGGWAPHTILLGSLFFAGIDSLATHAQVSGFGIPYQFLLMLPYLATIIVMVFTFRRRRVPAFLGQNYDREKRSLT